MSRSFHLLHRFGEPLLGVFLAALLFGFLYQGGAEMGLWTQIPIELRLLVQGVGGRFRHAFDRPWPAGPRRSALVVIGEKGIDEAAIRAALA